MERLLIREIIQTGRYLFEAGVVDYYAGNISAKVKRGLLITRSGSPLPLLTERDIVLARDNVPLAGKPSSEFIVHRAVLEKTDYRAVVHAHPPSVVALTFKLDGFYVPKDNEARLLLGKIPVVRVEKPSASPELARVVSETLKDYPCAIVYSHGVFCGGDRPLKAAGLITALEMSAKISLLSGG